MLQVPAVSGIRVVMLTSFLIQSSRRAYASIREWKWVAWGRERQRFTVAGLYEYYYWTMTHLILTGFLCCCCFKKKKCFWVIKNILKLISLPLSFESPAKLMSMFSISLPALLIKIPSRTWLRTQAENPPMYLSFQQWTIAFYPASFV